MMKRMGGFGSKMAKKNRKAKKGSGGGRVTEGRAPLRLPDLDAAAFGRGEPGSGRACPTCPIWTVPGGSA